MSRHQIITTESGDELVVLSRAEFDALEAAAGDPAAEARSMRRIAKDVAVARRDEHEFDLPDWLSEAIMAGETPIRAARRRAGLTQAALALTVGITQGYLSDIESRRKAPAPDLSAKLATALDLDPKLLLPEEVGD